jgi:rRNA maturation protein Nop10
MKKRQKRPHFLSLKQPCPYCNQGYTLELLVCPRCGALVAACVEAGCLFADPVALSEMAAWPCDVWYFTHTKCPRCGVEADFRHATPEEAESHGLTRERCS